ncbi:MAG: hypothetical protein A3H27_17520 [Acidobacteria bacterium RIFCSPLOWO2_02_FULL_59_13]|nr:MAG: hypothetical protein A3H27_17520 [Acidobacteria bacterium RIFCSPLOWO2_02_FULL_59_13]
MVTTEHWGLLNVDDFFNACTFLLTKHFVEQNALANEYKQVVQPPPDVPQAVWTANVVGRLLMDPRCRDELGEELDRVAARKWENVRRSGLV